MTRCTVPKEMPYRAISLRSGSISIYLPPTTRSAIALRVPGTSRAMTSISLAILSMVVRSEPATLTPIGVRIPVVSMSSLILIG